MKKTLLSLLSVSVVAAASAMTVSQPVKVNTGGAAHNLTLSPDGATMLFSTDDHTGLKMLKLGTADIITIDEAAGAGFCPVFSTDGKEIIYQTAAQIDGLLNRDIRSYSISNGKSKQLAAMSRNDIDLNKISGTADYVLAGINNIVVCENGVTRTIDPIADAHSYLWASVSPDGSRLVFVEPFQGVFVSDLNGDNLVKIASKGAFPSWASNNLVTFVLSHDDGYVILDSTLRIHDISTGITLDLTDADVKVGEAAAANGNVVYSTLEGEVFLFNVK